MPFANLGVTLKAMVDELAEKSQMKNTYVRLAIIIHCKIIYILIYLFFFFLGGGKEKCECYYRIKFYTSKKL